MFNWFKSTGIVVLFLILIFILLYLNNSILPSSDLNVPLLDSFLRDQRKNLSILILLTGSQSKVIHSKEQIEGSVEIHTEIIQSNREIDAFDCCWILNKYERHRNNIFCFVIPEHWPTIHKWLVKVINKMSLAPTNQWDFLVSNGDHLTYATSSGSIVIDKERSRRIFLGASFNSMQKLCRRFKTNSQRWEYLSAGKHGFSVKTLSSILSNNPEIELGYLLEASKYQKFKANRAAELINQNYFTLMAGELQKDKGINSKVFLCIFIS